MKNIIICGCCGKMGKVIASVCDSNDKLNVIAGVDGYDSKDRSFPVYPSFSEIGEKADVIIDFSNPSVLDEMLDYAIKSKTPIVIATTGYNGKDLEKINNAAKEIPILFSYNMSIGINLLTELAKTAAKLLGNDFDIEFIEKHHNQKIDAPSGTALMLANAMSETLKEKPIYEYDRHSKRARRQKNEIGIHSIRGGTIVGEHEIIFAGHDEVISLKHQANSKEIFAHGAVNAALFIANKPAGLYSMHDMID